MTTLKASVMANGQVISNNDPLMVITLDPHPGVQISSIQDDSITYEFTGEVTAEALYNLNLTFTYNNTHRVKVPCTFKQKVIEIDYTVTPKQINTKMWGHGTDLPFTVMVGEEDITSRLVDVTLVPNEWLKSYADVGGSAAEWYMTGIQVNTVDTIVNGTFRFKLPVEIDPAGIVREHTGEFRVAPYDGRETTVTHEIETLMVPLSDRTPINYLFTVSYRGMPNSNNQVSLLSNSTYFGCTPGVTTKVGSDQLAISFDGGKVKGEGTTTLYFGKTGEAVSKMAIVPLNTKVYRAGVDVVLTPDRITGKSGTEHETTVHVEVDGVATKNTDVTFANVAGDLQFVSATDTTVVWKILRTNTGTANVDFATGINVTKSGKAGASYAQNVTVLPAQLNVEWVTTAADLVGAATNHITLKITDEKGEPAVGVVKKTLNMESVPKNRPDILAGYSNTLTALPEEGSYQLSANLGHLNASFTIDLVLTYDGLDFTIPTKTFATPGTPVKVTIDKTKLLTTDPANTCSLTFKQDKWLTPDADVTGKLNTYAVTGGGTSGSTAPMDINNGKLSINIVPNGKLEDIVINGTVTESDGSSSRPFTVDITIEQDKLTLSALGSTVLTPLKASNQPQFQVKTSKGVALSSVTSSKFTLVSDPAAGIVLANKPNIANVAGRSVDYYVDIDVGHMPGEVSFGGTFTYKGLEYVIETPITFTSAGVPMTSVATPSTINAGEDVQVEVTFKQLRTTASVLTTVDGTLESQQSGPGMTIVSQFAAKPGSPGTFVGTVRGATPGTQGQLKFTLVEQYDGFTKRWVDTFTDFTVDVPLEHPFTVNVLDNPFTGKFGETKNLGVSLTQNGNAVTLTDPTLHFSFAPEGYLELISVQPTALVVEFIKDPTVEVLPSQMKLMVSDGTDFGEGFFDMVTQTNKVKPVMTVGGPVDTKLFDTGPLPIMVIDSNGLDVFSKASNWTNLTYDNILVDADGQYHVTAADLTPKVETIKPVFTIVNDGIGWLYHPEIMFNIDPAPSNDSFVVKFQPENIVAEAGEDRTITVYPELQGKPVPADVDVSFIGSGSPNVTLVGTAISPAGTGLEIIIHGEDVVDGLEVQVVYKLKGTPGDIEGLTKVTSPPSKLYIFQANTINIVPGTVRGDILTGPIDTVSQLTFDLYLGGTHAPMNHPALTVSVEGTGARMGMVSAEDVIYYANTTPGSYTPRLRIAYKDIPQIYKEIPLTVTITEGQAQLVAMWFPENAQGLSPNTTYTITGVMSGNSGGPISNGVISNQAIENSPNNGNAIAQVTSNLVARGLYYDMTFKTGHTGESAVVTSDVLQGGTKNHKQRSRAITVKQEEWHLAPFMHVDSSVENKVSVVEFRMNQRRLDGPFTIEKEGAITNVKVSGAGKNAGPVTGPNQDGKYSIQITSDGTEGDVILSGVVTDEGIKYPFSGIVPAFSTSRNFEVSSAVKDVVVPNGSEKTIPVTLKYDGVDLPIDATGIKAYLDNAAVSIVSITSAGIKLKFNSRMTSEFEHYVLNVKVTYKGMTATLAVEVRETLVGKTKPTLTVTGEVTARVGDKGKLPITIKAGETDITELVYTFSTPQNDYITIDHDTGEWTCTKEEANQSVLTQPYYITLIWDGIQWSYSPEITFNIGPDVPTAKLVDASDTLTMDLWEVKPITFKVMLGETDISSSVTSIVNDNAENIAEMFEFVSISEGVWGFKSIKSEPDATLGTTGIVTIKVTHESVDYNLPLSIRLRTNPNPGTIETQRFKVEAV